MAKLPKYYKVVMDGMTNYHLDEIYDDMIPVKTAHWQPDTVIKNFSRCSNCHECYIETAWLSGGKWRFCPTCGLKMEGR